MQQTGNRTKKERKKKKREKDSILASIPKEQIRGIGTIEGPSPWIPQSQSPNLSILFSIERVVAWYSIGFSRVWSSIDINAKDLAEQ
jgi:hypothetical protein